VKRGCRANIRTAHALCDGAKFTPSATRGRQRPRATPTATVEDTMKRIILFVATNLAVVLVLSIVLRIFGLDRSLAAQGFQYGQLLVYSLVVGFAGAIISLLMSKSIAKWTTGAHVIETPANESEAWLVETVRKLATSVGIAMPEVGIYEGAANAFATGAFKNSAFVAVSTGLLQAMNHEEVEAVLGHEISHVANGDMVTLTLIQGVVNTFVVFLSRIVGSIVDRTVFRTERGTGPGYFITVIVCQIVFGILASVIVAWFSRWREFRADAGSARLLGAQPMIHALQRLGGLDAGGLPQAMNAFGIAGSGGFMALFASHPPIEERIAALQSAPAGR
jgi:heat shock protein HtpX